MAIGGRLPGLIPHSRPRGDAPGGSSRLRSAPRPQENKKNDANK